MNEVEARLGEDHVIYVDGGDSPYNTTLANVSMGNVSVDALSALGLDATVLGNHDFDYSLENLLRLRDRAQYAMLSANTKFKEGKAYAGEKEYPFGDYITKGSCRSEVRHLRRDGRPERCHDALQQHL